MQDFGAAFGLAFGLIASGDADLAEIVLLSLAGQPRGGGDRLRDRPAARRRARGAALSRPRRARSWRSTR